MRTLWNGVRKFELHAQVILKLKVEFFYPLIGDIPRRSRGRGLPV